MNEIVVGVGAIKEIKQPRQHDKEEINDKENLAQ